MTSRAGAQEGAALPEPLFGQHDALLDAIGDGIAVTDAQGVIVYCNAPLAALIGVGVDALRGSNLLELFASGARDDLRRLQLAVAATGVPQRTSVVGAGPQFTASAVLRPLRGFTQRSAGHVVWCLAEVSTGWLPTRFEVAVSHELGFWEFNVAADEVRWLSDWCGALGIDPCLGANHTAQWDRMIHPDDLQDTYDSYRGTIQGTADLYVTEYRLRTRAGDWRWVMSRGWAAERNAVGRALRLVGVIIDIDARKRAELALRESESRLEAALWGTRIGLWEEDVGHQFRWFDDWAESVDVPRSDGRDGGELWRSLMHPDDLGPAVCAEEECHRGLADHYVVEYRIRTRSGAWRWLHERGKVTARDENGRVRRFVGVCFDVDERKKVETALRNSEARLETAVWGADLGLWDWQSDTGELTWLSEWPARFGLGAAARASRTAWQSRVHPQDRARLDANARALLEGSDNATDSDYRVQSSEGHWRWVNVRTRVIERGPNGAARRMVGACIDVDARRRAEQVLHTQAVILETMREAVILIDMDGLVEFTNPAFDRMFGREPGAILGTSVFTLLNRRRHHSPPLPAIEAALRRWNGRTGNRDVLFRRGDGSGFVGQAIAATIELGGAKKSLVVIQDVSERKELEREIIEIANRERRRLGSDLHDGLGQELTGISLMLRGLAKRLNPEARCEAPEVDEIIGLVNHAIQTARTMAVGLSLVTFAHGGLLAALESLTNWSQQNYGIEVRLRLLLRSPLVVTEATATHLYLIAQEAITNAVKHGRARLITVTLGTNRSIVMLTVTDDGIGIPTPLHNTGMGVKIMEYRAGMIGGSVQLKRCQGGGTRMRCVCPQTTPETDREDR